MLGRMLGNAVEQKIGTSKVIENFREAYDYIIVGAGAAGNVLASRLTENPDTTVLLLEAGGDDVKSPGVHIPASATELQQSDFNYGYRSVPQDKACQGLNEKQVLYPRGKGLGGSGSINYMSYTRGSRYDYDEWAELGCSGWSYRDVLPYFIKSEDNSNPAFVKSGYHGRGGPMKISDFKRIPLVTTFLEAGRELGYDITDINGANQIGFANQQGMLYKGMRWSTAHGYLRPAMDRDNLDVAINSQVNQLLFTEDQVTGVEINKGEGQHKVKATREVILSAGAIESPKILMLSGIGPRAELDKFQIPVRANLPVGENLQDHPMCIMEYKIERPLSLNTDQSYYETPASKEYQQYLFFNYDEKGAPPPAGGVAFFRTRLASAERQSPDILLQMATSLIGGIFRKLWNVKGEIFDSLYSSTDEDKRPGMYLTSYLLHPYSRGSITLSSRSPADKPNINPRFLDHPSDAQALVEGIKLQLELQNTPSFQKIGAAPSPGMLPGYEKGSEYSDDYLEKFVRHQTLTGHHATGTCRMGPSGDHRAVVDNQLRVHGIRGLRVVDASVMPQIPSGNTSAPTVMIAEKAADMIREINSVTDIRLPADIDQSQREASASV